MTPTMDEELLERWNAASDLRAKDRLVAEALGAEIVEGDGSVIAKWKHHGEVELPLYTSHLSDAERAMEMAWELMEESTPYRVSCSVQRGGESGSRDCYVEWWEEEGDHNVTPIFPTEAESRAFAAYVFAQM